MGLEVIQTQIKRELVNWKVSENYSELSTEKVKKKILR